MYGDRLYISPETSMGIAKVQKIFRSNSYQLYIKDDGLIESIRIAGWTLSTKHLENIGKNMPTEVGEALATTYKHIPDSNIVWELIAKYYAD